MAAWREIPDRREQLAGGRVRLWFDVGQGSLRCATTQAAIVDDQTIERIGQALADLGPLPRLRTVVERKRQ